MAHRLRQVGLQSDRRGAVGGAETAGVGAMKFLLDLSPAGLQRKRFPEYVCGQLLTPLTRYADAGGVYAIDNGSFSQFPEVYFTALLERQAEAKDRCLWVACPDVVGNARRTFELWRHRDRWLNGWPAALVLQNGAEDFDIPWGDTAAVFIGGQDPWKESQACADLVRTAVALRVPVHVGRVNGAGRFKRFRDLGAATCDGSGVCKYDHMLQSIILDTDGRQPELF